jgi:hypothetical protein
VGITSNLPGKRADLLIPDDIETNKNGLTAAQRDLLLHLSKEFSSICTHGDILYLGTPQSKDSIYNTLPGRGYGIRIWPGRYPNNEELEKYSDRLAPSIATCIRADPTLQRGGGIDGSRGKPTDPQRYTEEALCEKELDKGPEDFQLQYMLDTSLVDAQRQQLKLSDLVIANFDADLFPEIIVHQLSPKYLVDLGPEFPVPMTKMYHPVAVDCRFVPSKERFMFIDPAGGGSDEYAFAVSTAVGPYIHVLDVGGLKGGMSGDNPDTLCDVIRDLQVTDVLIESNMGHGSMEILLRAELQKRNLAHVGVRGEYSTGQKERRIIDSLVGPMQRHRVVIHKRVFESDVKYGKQHSVDSRTQFSMFYQLSNLTTDRNSLVKDDRLEAMAGAVRRWKNVLATDEHKAAEARARATAQAFLADPMGYGISTKNKVNGTRKLVHGRRARK